MHTPITDYLFNSICPSKLLIEIKTHIFTALYKDIQADQKFKIFLLKLYKKHLISGDNGVGNDMVSINKWVHGYYQALFIEIASRCDFILKETLETILRTKSTNYIE
jgi:hypothetical protein